MDTGGDGALALYAGPISTDLTVPEDADLTIVDDEGGGFGSDAIVPGDLDGDGTADLLVGAPSADGDSGKLTLIPGSIRGQVRADEHPFIRGLEGSELGGALAATRWGSDGVDVAVLMRDIEGGWGTYVYTCLAGRTSFLGAEVGIHTDTEPTAWDVSPVGRGLYVAAEDLGRPALYAIVGPYGG